MVQLLIFFCSAFSFALRHPAGTGQNMFGLNWGNGFITDKAVIRERGLSDANSFFTNLVAKPYYGKVRAMISEY